MANIVPDSFKTDLLKGTFNFKSSAQGGGDTFKIALYTSLAAFSTSTTEYITTNQVANGNGYTTGGNTLTNAGLSISSNVAFVDFDDTTWSSASITAVGALIYKSSSNNEAVLVLDFGGTKTSTSGDFQIVFPAASSSAAIIRVGDA